MKMLKNGWLLLALVSLGFFAQAQVAEDIITESSEPEDEQFIDGVVKKEIIYEKRILEYDHVREADIAWEKKIWRIVDIREKMNLPFGYPKQPFVSILLDATSSGEVNAFEKDDYIQTNLSYFF